VHEQLEASGMDACEHRDGHARIQPDGGAHRDEQAEVQFAARERLRRPLTCRHEDVLDVGEAFGA
jgi:hypothetical protein